MTKHIFIAASLLLMALAGCSSSKQSVARVESTAVSDSIKLRRVSFNSALSILDSIESSLQLSLDSPLIRISSGGVDLTIEAVSATAASSHLHTIAAHAATEASDSSIVVKTDSIATTLNTSTVSQTQSAGYTAIPIIMYAIGAAFVTFVVLLIVLSTKNTDSFNNLLK